jgi:hypothetical protein
MRKLLMVVFAGSLLATTGCTIRHSRTLDNVGPAGGRRVSASSTGLEIFQIEVNDTESAANLARQAGGSCKALRNVETDYRTTGILIIGIPKLTVSADCE